MSSSARIREPHPNPTAESLYLAPGNFVRPGEQPAWETFNASFWDSLAPAGPVEALLVSEIARAAWRIRRCNNVEAGLSGQLSNPALDPMEDAATSDTQKKVDRARGQAERSIDRLLAQLRRSQTERQCRNESQPEDAGSPNPERELNPAQVPAAATDIAQTPIATPRNAPCPCGSGQKHKRCCGRNAPPILSSVLSAAA